MTSLGLMLKTEITRLSRKEIRAHIEPLRKANAAYRRDIAELKRQVAWLQRHSTAAGRGQPKVAGSSVETKPTRFVAKGLRSLRARLGLSAADFAKLANVSAQSIYNWETGKAVPRKEQVNVLVGLRGLNKKQAQARLGAALSTNAAQTKERFRKKT
jgi:DNA-binding transcriptional regulator YiaG